MLRSDREARAEDESASAIALLVYWGFNQRYSYRAIDTVWTVLLWVIGIGLLLTQL